jgi:SAM-dependent methyltransferase
LEPATSDQQMLLWNGTAGRGWIAAQAALDQMYKPFEDLLVQAAAAVPGGRILDIGCGTGSTTLAVARAGCGSCLGVDISEPMIAVAMARAERGNDCARFICADAETYAFVPGSFDAVISRFGIMFFADPVRAFINLCRAVREGGALHVFAWRGPKENSFMTAAERAAAPLLPRRAQSAPDGPGPFAFADAGRVRGVLEKSGWTGIDIRPIDIACNFPEAELVRYLTWMGPVGRILQEADDHTRALVVKTVRAAFEPYVHGAEVRFTPACWMIHARAPSASENWSG